MKITVELDEDQVYTINHALEIYCRLCMGQLDMIPHAISRWNVTEQIRNDIALLKLSLFPELQWNESWGIGQEQSGERAHIAWDIYQQLRHDITWKYHPEGGMSVSFDKPMQVCTKHRLPKVTIED